MAAADTFDTLKTVVAIIGGGGFFGLAGWLVSQARGWGRLEARIELKLESLSNGIQELKAEMRAKAAEDNHSKQDQGKRIGNLESEVLAIKAVREALDDERSRPYSNVPQPVR